MEYKYVNLTKENLKIIKSIDDNYYNLDIRLEWYLQRYNENHNAIFLCDNDKCVGYIVCVPIRRELYRTIYSGVLVNDFDINPNMFIEKSKYNYIVSCVLLSEYRNKGYGSILMEKCLKILRVNIVV